VEERDGTHENRDVDERSTFVSERGVTRRAHWDIAGTKHVECLEVVGSSDELGLPVSTANRAVRHLQRHLCPVHEEVLEERKKKKKIDTERTHSVSF
jgi:hypothetical protein